MLIRGIGGSLRIKNLSRRVTDFASIAFGYPNAFCLGRTQPPVVVLLGPRGRSTGIVLGKANLYSGSVRFGGDTLQVNLACKRRQNARYKKRLIRAHCKRRYVERETEQEQKKHDCGR